MTSAPQHVMIQAIHNQYYKHVIIITCMRFAIQTFLLTHMQSADSEVSASRSLGASLPPGAVESQTTVPSPHMLARCFTASNITCHVFVHKMCLVAYVLRVFWIRRVLEPFQLVFPASKKENFPSVPIFPFIWTVAAIKRRGKTWGICTRRAGKL